MTNEIEDYCSKHDNLNVKLFNVIPTRFSFIPGYVCFDTKCLIKLFHKTDKALEIEILRIKKYEINIGTNISN